MILLFDKHGINSCYRPDPPEAVLDHFVQVYETTVHLQPLPLFELDSLKAKLQDAPKYFMHSFLALMLQFSTHDFYQKSHPAATSFYSRSAAATTQRLAAEGKPRVDVIQALCMLALKHIAGKIPHKKLLDYILTHL
jgi:hypothetical protein